MLSVLSGVRRTPSSVAVLSLLTRCTVCATVAGGLSPAVLAQSGVASGAASGALAPVVVTAARTAQPLTDVVSDVSLIDLDTLDRFANASLGDVLSTLPGVELSRNGGPTATTSLFVRGADTRHTVLLIDGVRVDSQSTGGAAWQALALEHIDRIEVLRGPAAAIYGSDAIGGVVQVFTRKGEAGFHPNVSVGVGSHGTRNASAQLSGAQGAWDYALGLTRETSDGFNIQPSGNPDRDGYRKTNGLARLGLQANADHRFEALWTSSEANTGYDAYASKVDDRALQDLRTLALSWQARWSDVWTSRVGFTRGLDRYETTPSAYVTDTQVDTWLWHNQWQLGAHQLTAALERRQDRLLNGSTTPQLNDRSQNALALGYGFKQGDHTVQANLRHDDDSEFGRHTTGSLAYALALAPHWRVTASAGTAFRAPTLFHRFSIYGMPSLRPEESRNLELALKYAAQGSSFSVTAYRNRLTNLINYVSGPGSCANGVGAFPGCYGNVGKATLQGVTLAAATRVAAGVPGGVGLNASIDLQNPRDDTTGRTLARRSKRVAKLGADLRVAGWTLGAETQWHSSRFDQPSGTARLAGYGVVNLSASTRLAPQWTLVARVDNLGDKAYQTARGYATPGRTAYLGVSWTGL